MDSLHLFAPELTFARLFLEDPRSELGKATRLRWSSDEAL